MGINRRLTATICARRALARSRTRGACGQADGSVQKNGSGASVNQWIWRDISIPILWTLESIWESPLGIERLHDSRRWSGPRSKECVKRDQLSRRTYPCVKFHAGLIGFVHWMACTSVEKGSNRCSAHYHGDLNVAGLRSVGEGDKELSLDLRVYRVAGLALHKFGRPPVDVRSTVSPR